ncbi:MAG: macro domain-containing protein [Deltaproteobacteria bacterium]|nr:macro domain-containing protein [Deltaproteobacteria bacterium]
MIHEVSGDILLTKAHALAHGIAPNDPFDQGLARALREQWPAMHRDYHHYANQTHPKPGELWSWGTSGKRVIALLTQEGGFEHGARPGRATVGNVNHCLRRLRHELEKEGITSVALPRLATGVGKLAWEEVMPLIDKHLGNLAIPIFVYATYKPGVQAVEPGL